jgi:potassium channel subfamily K member 18
MNFCAGFGHLFPITQLGKLLICPFVLIGGPLFLVAIADFGRFFAEFISFLYNYCHKQVRKVVQKFKRRKASPISNQQNNNSSIKSAKSQKQQEEEKSTQGVSLNLNDVVVFGDEDIEEESQNGDKGKPISAAFLFFILAVPLFTILATIYVHMEGWLWLDSFYFVIVTFFGIGEAFERIILMKKCFSQDSAILPQVLPFLPLSLFASFFPSLLCLLIILFTHFYFNFQYNNVD